MRIRVLLLVLIALVWVCSDTYAQTITRDDIIATVQHMQVRVHEAESAQTAAEAGRVAAEKHLAEVETQLINAQTANSDALKANETARVQAAALQSDDDQQRERAQKAETDLEAKRKLVFKLYMWLAFSGILMLALLLFIFRRPLGLLFGVPIP